MDGAQVVPDPVAGSAAGAPPSVPVDLRVDDDERRAVDERLQRAVGRGLLTLAEYEERAGAVWAARTRGQLEATVRDLPQAAPQVPPPAAGGLRPRRVLAVMSGDALSGPVRPGQDVHAYAVMGGATVDLRRADLPAQVRVRAVAVMGGVEVLVPRGVTVHLSGVSLMGGRQCSLEPARAGAPVVEVEGYALMGGVEVTHGRGPEGRGVPGAGWVSLRKDGPGAGGAGALGTWQGVTGQGVAGGRAGRSPARVRGRRRRSFVLSAVALIALAVGVPAVAQADQAVVFGSQDLDLRSGDSVDVGVLFGSVKVSVLGDAPVQLDGGMIFGSQQCRGCRTSSTAPPVHVHGRGAFGSIEVVRRPAPADLGR